MDYLSEVYLGYTPVADHETDRRSQGSSSTWPTCRWRKSAEYSAEDADVTLQLRAALEPLLKEKGQERVFYDIESPLIPVLVEMEFEGIKVDAAALAEFGAQLSKEMDVAEKTICQLAGTTFNLNSPRQLGQILFDILKICDAPKKTKTGQYATDEQTLAPLAPDHEIVQRLLEYRAATKLKSTYADALPAAIWPATGRVHTTFNQVMTTTGRLNSQDPNLQNIPIRTERGQEIRKAFVPRGEDYLLLSADYSQIELRIIAALSREAAMLEAFSAGADIHTATAAQGLWPLPGDGHARHAAQGQDGQLRHHLRHLGVRTGATAGHPAHRSGRDHRAILQAIPRHPPVHGSHHRLCPRTRLRRDRHRPAPLHPRHRLRQQHRARRRRAQRHQRSHPGHRRRHDQTRNDQHPARIDSAESSRPGCCFRSMTNWFSISTRRRRKRVRALVEEKMKTAIPLDVPIEVEIGAGENWLEAH